MSESVFFAVADCGATANRIAVVDQGFNTVDSRVIPTDPNYEANPSLIAEAVHELAGGLEITAAGIALAGTVDQEGTITQAGNLTGWVGRSLGEDLAAELGLPPERSGVLNRTVAAALGQQHARGRGDVTMMIDVGRDFNGAKITERPGVIIPDEPGHQHLGIGGICPCGEEGHVDAFLSRTGIARNHGELLETWIEKLPNRRQYITDLTTALLKLIERQDNAGDSEPIKAIRWTGSVALGQRIVFLRAEHPVFKAFYEAGRSIDFALAAKGKDAELYGAFVYARHLAAAK